VKARSENEAKITERYQNGFYRSVLRVVFGNIVFTKVLGKYVSETYLSLCDRSAQVSSVPEFLARVEDYVRCALRQELQIAAVFFFDYDGHHVGEGKLQLGQRERSREFDVPPNSFRLLKWSKLLNGF